MKYTVDISGTVTTHRTDDPQTAMERAIEKKFGRNHFWQVSSDDHYKPISARRNGVILRKGGHVVTTITMQVEKA